MALECPPQPAGPAMAATAATNDALIKFSFCSGGKSQLRRTRVPSLEALNFTLLQDLASEVFPEAPKGRLEFSYEDDEGEKVNISNDRDYAECCQVMDTVNKKALRIELTICEEERDERASRPRAGECSIATLSSSLVHFKIGRLSLPLPALLLLPAGKYVTLAHSGALLRVASGGRSCCSHDGRDAGHR